MLQDNLEDHPNDLEKMPIKILEILFCTRLSKMYYPLYLLPMTAWGSEDPEAGRPRAQPSLYCYLSRKKINCDK